MKLIKFTATLVTGGEPKPASVDHELTKDYGDWVYGGFIGSAKGHWCKNMTEKKVIGVVLSFYPKTEGFTFSGCKSDIFSVSYSTDNMTVYFKGDAAQAFVSAMDQDDPPHYDIFKIIAPLSKNRAFNANLPKNSGQAKYRGYIVFDGDTFDKPDPHADTPGFGDDPQPAPGNESPPKAPNQGTPNQNPPPQSPPTNGAIPRPALFQQIFDSYNAQDLSAISGKPSIGNATEMQVTFSAGKFDVSTPLVNNVNYLDGTQIISPDPQESAIGSAIQVAPFAVVGNSKLGDWRV